MKEKNVKHENIQKDSDAPSSSSRDNTTARSTPDTDMDEPNDDTKRRRLEELIKQRDDDNTVHVLDLMRYRAQDKMKWDLSKKAHRNEAIKIITEIKPAFVIAKSSEEDSAVLAKLCSIQKAQGGHFEGQLA